MKEEEEEMEAEEFTVKKEEVAFKKACRWGQGSG